MKTLHELYSLLWEQIKDKEVIPSLCTELTLLYRPLTGESIITKKEAGLLNNHFQSQKPSLAVNTEFMLSSRWLGGVRWWNKEEINDPMNRKAFVYKLLKESSVL